MWQAIRQRMRFAFARSLPPAALARASWVERLEQLIANATRWSPEQARYAQANRDSVQRAVSGQDPFGNSTHPGNGARMVVTISSAHIPAFCAAAARGDPKPYKNCHDLALGGGKPVGQLRMEVDEALPVVDMLDTYFGAVELNGCGVRFYGDMCLVLKLAALESSTVVLDRNSFELLRSPIAEELRSASSSQLADARKRRLQAWSGRWKPDLAEIATIKVLQALGAGERRWTTGQISRSVRDAEDYIEVLKSGSFGPGDLQEARISAEEAAHDALVASRLLRGPVPRLEAMVWRRRRSRAERVLRAAGVPLRVMTADGRTRG